MKNPAKSVATLRSVSSMTEGGKTLEIAEAMMCGHVRQAPCVLRLVALSSRGSVAGKKSRPPSLMSLFGLAANEREIYLNTLSDSD